MKTEPTGSQIFWLSIVIACYFAIFRHVYFKYEFFSDSKHVAFIVWLVYNLGVSFVHFLYYLVNEPTNLIHKVNPLVMTYLLMHQCFLLVQKFNKFLDKIFD